jgi:hypothetical protein
MRTVILSGFMAVAIAINPNWLDLGYTISFLILGGFAILGDVIDFMNK